MYDNYHTKSKMDKAQYRRCKTKRGRFLIIHKDDINTVKKLGSGFTKLDESFKPEPWE
jgi:hypothetical protein